MTTPTVNITIDPSKEFLKGTILDSLQEIGQATGYITPPHNYPSHDQWGTSLVLFNMPDTLDTKAGAAIYMDSHYVSNMSMLAMRMRWAEFGDGAHQAGTPKVPFDHITIHRSKDRYLVFVVHEGNPVILEDDLALFPSDSLCTRLRMLKPEQP